MSFDPIYTYGCCVHCDDDPIHDVEPNMHEIRCNSVRWPEKCEEGWTRYRRDDGEAS